MNPHEAPLQKPSFKSCCAAQEPGNVLGLLITLVYTLHMCTPLHMCVRAECCAATDTETPLHTPESSLQLKAHDGLLLSDAARTHRLTVSPPVK